MSANDLARSTFLLRWRDHDEASAGLANPRSRAGALSLQQQADALERAAGDYAGTIGMTTNTFRDLLAALRRAGFERARALDLLDVIARTDRAEPLPADKLAAIPGEIAARKSDDGRGSLARRRRARTG